jgi:putative flippase GtrA
MAMQRNLITLIQQGGKFGIVGMLATATHVGLMVVMVEWFGWRPLIANFGAFGVAFVVSFVGHYRWTFADQRAAGPESWRGPLARFIVMSLTGLALNSLAVFMVVDVLGLSYVYALAIMVSVVPAILFVIGKFWAFA